jgi:hypothetical protein
MTGPNEFNDQSTDVEYPWAERRWNFARGFACHIANRRWIAEMQHKYDVTYVNAVDFMDGLTDFPDYRRACEIEEEELGFVAHLDPNDPRYMPSAGSPDDLMNVSDYAHGMLLSELLGLDGDSIAADLDRIEVELRRLREELGDGDDPQV